MFLTLHKLALEKQAICKIIFQILEHPKIHTIFINQVATGSVIENKWKVLV